jgi:outer membrane protein assembly factor BamB
MESVTPLDETRLLVTMGDGKLAALSRETGNIVWEVDLGGSIGPPLIEGNTIVVRRIVEDDVNYQDSQVTLHGLDAEIGEEQWTALTMTAGYAGGFHPIKTTPEFVLVREAVDEVPNVQPMHAVSLADGSTKWTADVGSHRGTHVRNGTIYYAAHNGVTAFEFDGSRRWEWSQDASDRDVGETTLVCDHVVIQTGDLHESGADVIHGVDIENGEGQWTFDGRNGTERGFGELYGYRGRLLALAEKQTHLNPTNGEPVWIRGSPLVNSCVGYGMMFGKKYDDPTITSRAIPDGTTAWEQQVDRNVRMIGVGNGQLLIYGPLDESFDGSSYIEALDTATGEQLWTLDAEQEFWGHGAMIGSRRVYVPDQIQPRTEQTDIQGTLRAVTI